MSSGEEDFELRDLVVQTLNKNGSLTKIRAELRATTFLALEEDLKLRNQEPLKNLKLQAYLETHEGKAMFWLVHEFLDFFNLQFTISVFEPESYLDSIGLYKDRQQIFKELGLHSIKNPRVPLLEQLIKNAQAKDKVDINLHLNGNNNNGHYDKSLDPTHRNILASDTFTANTRLYQSSKKKKDTNELIINPKNNSNIDDDKKPSSIIKEGDTYEDTSLFAEDTETLANCNNETPPEKEENKVPLKNFNVNNKLNTTFLLTNTTPPQLSKTGLSSLTDLSPFSVNKSRAGNDILPSLYSKEYKNKSNLKELDKMFDMEIEYEEDFMYSSTDLSLNTPPVNSSNSIQSNKIDLEKFIVTKAQDSSKTVQSKEKKKCYF